MSGNNSNAGGVILLCLILSLIVCLPFLLPAIISGELGGFAIIVIAWAVIILIILALSSSKK